MHFWKAPHTGDGQPQQGAASALAPQMALQSSCTAAGCADSAKRPLGRKYEDLSGEASCKRCLSSFQPDAFIIIKADKFIHEFPGLLERFYFFSGKYTLS